MIKNSAKEKQKDSKEIKYMWIIETQIISLSEFRKLTCKNGGSRQPNFMKLLYSDIVSMDRLELTQVCTFSSIFIDISRSFFTVLFKDSDTIFSLINRSQNMFTY